MNYRSQLTVILFFLITGALTSPLIAQQVDTLGVIDSALLLELSPLDSVGLVRFMAKGCHDSTYFVDEVKNLEGWINYRTDLKSYVIVYGVPSTIDSQDVHTVCLWPEMAKYAGRPMIFSGRRYHARGIPERYGGDRILYLHLTAFRLN